MIETNKHKIHHKLKKKKWDKPFISKTLHILKNAEKHKHPHFKKIDKIIYWIFIAVMIICNILVFVGITPIMINNSQIISYSTILIVGLCLGFFIDYVLRHMDIDYRHYLFSGIFIPLVSMTFLIFYLDYVKSQIKEVGWFISINIILFVIIYTIGYSIPHFIYKITENKDLK
jgi:hypothetical protein